MRRNVAILLITLTIASMIALPYIGLVNAEPKTIVIPDDYTSIQDAINNADEGDTIFIKKGTYVENPVVNKSVSLMGEDRDSTVIDVTAGLTVLSNYVNITGLTLFDGYRGLTVSANSCRITGNKIIDSQTGVALIIAYDNVVAENTFQNIGRSAAIELSYANNNLIQYNSINSCTEGIHLIGSSNNTVVDNLVSNCQDVAIRLLGGRDGNIIMRNNISTSGVGTTVYGTSNNVISNNNYVNNTVQFSANEGYYLTFGANRSINTINRNYWSNYNGTDTNNDGIGDSPYVIDEYNQDNQPLTKSIEILTLPLHSAPSSSTPTPTFPLTDRNAPHLDPIVYLIPIGVILAGVIALIILFFSKHRKARKQIG